MKRFLGPPIDTAALYDRRWKLFQRILSTKYAAALDEQLTINSILFSAIYSYSRVCALLILQGRSAYGEKQYRYVFDWDDK